LNRLRRVALWTAQKAREQGALVRGMFDLRDIFWIGGLSAVGYGVAQIHVPAAWIICGAVVFWMGVRR
jgi:hypothetical protein